MVTPALAPELPLAEAAATIVDGQASSHDLDPATDKHTPLPPRPPVRRPAGEIVGEPAGETAHTKDKSADKIRKLDIRSSHADSLGVDRGPSQGLNNDGENGASSLAKAALDRQEVRRARYFLAINVGIMAIVSGMLLTVGGDPMAKTITLGGLWSTVVVFTWAVRHFGNRSQYTPRRILAVTCFSLIATYPSVYFWGPASPAPVIFAVCIAFISQGTHLSLALTAYLLCAISQITVALLPLFGVIPDRSVIAVGSLGVREFLVLQVIIQSMYGTAFAAGRFHRNSIQQAMQRLENAVREVARRDALLQEAHRDLDQAQRIGAPGRFSGQRMGSYRLQNILGQGGMGEVYEAYSTESGRVAAVKLLHHHAFVQKHSVARFLREAENAARIDTANVVKVYEHGCSPEGFPYLTMERLVGEDLAQILRRQNRLPLSEVYNLIQQIGSGIEAARTAGIVHRDIKPQNLFATTATTNATTKTTGRSKSTPKNSDSGNSGDSRDRGRDKGPRVWKILDFGISTMAYRGAGTLTQGRLLGTPGYMAPEQATGAAVDHRTDLFSLAAVAYRALTGQPPFPGRDVAAILYRLVHEHPEPPSNLVQIPDDVDYVFAIALAKRSEDRFDSGDQMAQALKQALHGNLASAIRARGSALLSIAAHDLGKSAYAEAAQ